MSLILCSFRLHVHPMRLLSIRTRKNDYNLFAVLISVLLVACGNTYYAVPPHAQAQELSNLVLILEEESNGQIHHSWQHATEISLPRHEQLLSTNNRFGCIVLSSNRPRNCDQEQIDCVQDCMKSRLPQNLNHIKRIDGGKKRFCEKKCLDEYMDCLELQKSRALEFNTTDAAIEWLKRNREQLLVGTIIVIVGVAFVTLITGTGALVLVPVVLLAT